MDFDDLPDGWEIATLPDMICEDGILTDGDWIESKDQDQNGDIRLIQLADIGDGKYTSKSSKFLTSEKAKELNCTILEIGDLLISRLGEPLGKSCIFPGDTKPSITVVDVCIFRSGKKGIDHQWLMLFLNSPSIRQEISDLSSGTTRQRISKKNLATIQIPLPPLNEQKRIVEKIELIQERTKIVKRELENIKVLLKKLRRSLLASAFRGDLTKDWRANHPDIEPWIHTTLEKIILEKPKNGLSIKAVDYQTNVKSLVLTATTSGIFKPEYFKYLDIEIQPDSYLWLKPKDILIQRSNSLDKVGIAAIYTGQEQEFIYPDIMIKVKVNESLAIPEFVHYSLNNIKTRVYYRENATGTAGNMPKINQPTVMNTPISIPPLEEQKEIVKKLEKMMKFADQVEERVKEAEEKLNKFNQSVLAKAFRGKLVPQDPNDEPASVLLGKIQQEKNKTTIKKTKK